jgi:hypothetical protein
MSVDLISAEDRSRVQLVFLGLIRRDEDTPQHVIDTVYGWHNGKRSAMWRFHRGENVKPSALIREANKLLHEGTALGPEEDEKLRQLVIWASRREWLCKAAQALRDAHDDFAQKIEALQLDPHLVAAIRETAGPAGGV